MAKADCVIFLKYTLRDFTHLQTFKIKSKSNVGTADKEHALKERIKSRAPTSNPLLIFLYCVCHYVACSCFCHAVTLRLTYQALYNISLTHRIFLQHSNHHPKHYQPFNHADNYNPTHKTENTMNLTNKDKTEYIETNSHCYLAKRLGVTMLTLDTFAEEQGWKEEHRIYWHDKSIEILKQELVNGNIAAVKEMLKVTGSVRPVGRPRKSDIEREVAISKRIADEYEADAQRLSLARGK